MDKNFVLVVSKECLQFFKALTIASNSPSWVLYRVSTGTHLCNSQPSVGGQEAWFLWTNELCRFFRLLRFFNFWQFFDPLATLTIYPIILNYNLGRARWWAVDEFVLSFEELVPWSWLLSSPPSPPTPTPPFPGLVVDSILPEVFNIEVSGIAIWLKPWMERW